MLQLEQVDRPVAKPKHLAWLNSIAGELATATLIRLDETLPWYRQMPPARRAAVGSVAQAGITSFINWYENPQAQPWVAADVFGNAPRELLRSISLQETLQLIQVVVEMVEEAVVRDHPDLQSAILKYSRDMAFSAADVYAKAAEARGLWDARLEALVVDSIVSGERSQEISSRVAALGWQADGEVAVLLGGTPVIDDSDAVRKIARKLGADVLIGIQGRRQVIVIGLIEHDSNASDKMQAIATGLEGYFSGGPLVLGPTVLSVSDASRSANAALSAFSVAGVVSRMARPTQADQLLPERALAGDPTAKNLILETLYTPLADTQTDLLQTLKTYLDLGSSLEATSKELFVHANTVRYRLKKIEELIGADPTDPRTAFLLQIAIVLGSINDSESGLRR
ncbi:MAG: helix-turn-helix domain-containing protein [Aquiluna sp.]|nr:helix-turn-helix domain-containing protein [Aquiluna sp.]